MPNQIESYKEAIGIVGDHRFDEDARAILLEVMKSNPQVVVVAAENIWNPGRVIERAENLKRATWERMCIRLARDEKYHKIPVIKALRQESGLGLKEAKDFVEAAVPQHIFDRNREQNWI